MNINTNTDSIERYLEDASNLNDGYTDGVMIPTSEADIQNCIAQAVKEKKPLTLSAGRTGTTGSSIPHGGYVISLEKLNSIQMKGTDTVIVGPGVLYQDLDKELAKHKRMLAPNPTETTSCIGGNVATNASGSRSYKYGAIRKYINRIRVLFTSGEILNIKRGDAYADKQDIFAIPQSFKRPLYNVPPIKNAAGYFTAPGMDLIDIFIGSEGTLGIITEIELSTVLRPENLCAFFVFVPDCQTALQVVNDLKQHSILAPQAIEYFNHSALSLLQAKYSQIPKGTYHALYCEQDISKNEEHLLTEWMQFFESHQIPENYILFGQTQKDLSFYRDMRHSVPEAINERTTRQKHVKLNSDIAVPEKAFAEMIACYIDEFEKSGLEYYIFGHIGENHLHTNLILSNPNQYDYGRNIYTTIMKKAVSLGGTISAEHGVGKIKHDYLKIMYGEGGIQEMVRIKKILDPACILGRDNIFPEKYLEN